MPINPNFSPKIYYPEWLSQAHELFGPKAQRQVCSELERPRLARRHGHISASWMLGQQTTNNVLAQAFRMSDTLLGNASNLGRGLLGHAAHGVSTLSSALLTLPAWLSLDVEMSKYTFKCVSQTLLMPLGLPSLVSALVGLALKAAVSIIIVATVLLPSTLYHALCPPKVSKEATMKIEMVPLRGAKADVEHGTPVASLPATTV